jgi:hypothetical protein
MEAHILILWDKFCSATDEQGWVFVKRIKSSRINLSHGLNNCFKIRNSQTYKLLFLFNFSPFSLLSFSLINFH